MNAAHRLRSPLWPDGSFTLVTIPEERDLPGLVRYGDIPALRGAVPEKYWARATHYDPEFETLTYGDNCGWAPRAAALKRCRPGDWLFFIARLIAADGAPCFAIVGCLHVAAVLRDVRGRPDDAALARFGANAHVRRGLADDAWWDGFWVFAGGPDSGLFQRALVFGRAEADLLLRNRGGEAWDWRGGRSDLQTIGSYTRSCRCIIDPELDPERAQAWWALLRDRVGFAPWQLHSRRKSSQPSST